VHRGLAVEPTVRVRVRVRLTVEEEPTVRVRVRVRLTVERDHAIAAGQLGAAGGGATRVNLEQAVVVVHVQPQPRCGALDHRRVAKGGVARPGGGSGLARRGGGVA
tara:strand:+ start:390 stop:707 length:318 start_codon:yes stop_codon:yes gene_type:complete